MDREKGSRRRVVRIWVWGMSLAVGVTGLVLLGVRAGAQNPASSQPSQQGAGQQPNAPAAAPTGSSGPAPATAPDKEHAGTTPDQTHHIKVRVEVVNVPVSVLDKRGMPVIDLTPKDFKIFEDGKAQTIRYFRLEPLPPLRIGLVLDTSNSARPVMSFQKDAASEFVFNMLQNRGKRNQIFLQTFDATSSIIQDFTSDPDILNEKIRALKAGGGKALYDAIYSACKDKLMHAGEPESVRRVLVVISNGIDVQSQRSLDEALSMAHRAETAIYTIGNAAYGFSNPGDKVLQYIAEQTGGAAYFPLEVSPGADLGTGYLSHGQIGETSQNKGLGAETGIYSAERLVHLADALESINRELDEQYSIGYTPDNTTLDGTYRAIRVAVIRKGVSVRNKVGYFATAED